MSRRRHAAREWRSSQNAKQACGYRMRAVTRGLPCKFGPRPGLSQVANPVTRARTGCAHLAAAALEPPRANDKMAVPPRNLPLPDPARWRARGMRDPPRFGAAQGRKFPGPSAILPLPGPVSPCDGRVATRGRDERGLTAKRKDIS
jgi:hypothetical protein